ncbi:MAG TPA: ribosomal L7Ae/L30e/S12e/Gadd45 family protein [Gudongella oleilytica]|nr:ribosomal L7Ae/L30e/S12e/Gadd45 family protein [Gudongella oleilytica]
MLSMLRTHDKIVGAKQVKRALAKTGVEMVFIALDADKKVTGEIEELCRLRSVPITYVDRMEDLGEACGIDINAAVAALLNKN